MHPRLNAASPLCTIMAEKMPTAEEGDDAPAPKPSITAWKERTTPRINLADTKTAINGEAEGNVERVELSNQGSFVCEAGGITDSELFCYCLLP